MELFKYHYILACLVSILCIYYYKPKMKNLLNWAGDLIPLNVIWRGFYRNRESSLVLQIHEEDSKGLKWKAYTNFAAQLLSYLLPLGSTPLRQGRAESLPFPHALNCCLRKRNWGLHYSGCFHSSVPDGTYTSKQTLLSLEFIRSRHLKLHSEAVSGNWNFK